MKRKILFVVHQLNYGGVQKSLIAALNAINYEENEVTLYVRKNRIQLLDEANKNISKIIINKDTTHYYRKPYVVWLTLLQSITKILRMKAKEESIHKKIVTYINKSQMEYEKNHYFANGFEYDVAVSYIQGYTAQFVAEYISAKKKIMFFHGSVDENHELHEKIVPKFQKIVGVNNEVKKILAALYPANAKKMTYLENYVDAISVREKSMEYEISRNDKEFVICSCGRLVPVKGYDLAINTAKYLKKEGVSFYWYIVGDGPEREKLEKSIMQNDLKDCVEITGMKDNPYPYMRECDIYVQSSYEEAHPLTIIEAMILGCPVVTTATVGGRALVNHKKTGLVADINEKSLAKTIIQVIKVQELLQDVQKNLNEINFDDGYKKYCFGWNGLLEE